jgi:hypothetical protein
MVCLIIVDMATVPSVENNILNFEDINTSTTMPVNLVCFDDVFIPGTFSILLKHEFDDISCEELVAQVFNDQLVMKIEADKLEIYSDDTNIYTEEGSVLNEHVSALDITHHLKDIIGEISITYNNEPNEIIPIRSIEYEQYDIIIRPKQNYIYECISAAERVSDGHAFMKIKDRHIEIFDYKYYCHSSKSFIDKQDIFYIKKGHFIASPCALGVCEIPFIDQDNCNNISFIFNYHDTRKQHLLAYIMMLYKSLPQELVDQVIMQFIKVEDFYGGFECDYKGQLPKVISRTQLQQLHELEIVVASKGFNIIL